MGDRGMKEDIKSINDFVCACAEWKSNNLIGLLYFGGKSIPYSKNKYSDWDIVPIMKSFSVENSLAFRDITLRVEGKLDIPIVWMDQLSKNSTDFQLVSQGCWYLYVLKRALVVYGVNPLEDYDDPPMEEIQKSLRRKIIEYCDFFHKSILENSTLSVGLKYKLVSRLLKSVQDLLWFKLGVWNPAKISAVYGLNQVKSSILEDDEWEVLESVCNSSFIEKEVVSCDDKFIMRLFCIQNKIRLEVDK